MKISARVGATTELTDVDAVAVVARASDDGLKVSSWVPYQLGNVAVPRTFSTAWAAARGLSATVGSVATLRSADGPDVIVVSGGDEATNSLDEWRRIAAAAARVAGKVTLHFVLATDDVIDAKSVGQALAEGAALSAYQFLGYEDLEPSLVVVPVGELPTVQFHDALSAGVADGVVVASNFNWAKHLIDTPPGQLTPKDLARAMVAHLAPLPHVTVDAWSAPRIEEERLGGLLGVAAGSSQAPRLVYATYDPAPGQSLPHVALVGKGITFDSGGLSLKTAEGMTTMKTDMAGAATTMATFGAACRLGLRVKVTAITPLTENLPGPKATKPGDVLRTRNGMTIEVLNTDAEGRLVLADGLALAVEAQPDAIIDIATLTGAQRVALGDEVGALFSSSDDLAAELLAASESSGESLCRLPLYDGYESHIQSDVADMKNIGKPQNAGAVIAALILRRFTGEVPWAHFDVAGPGRTDSAHGYYTKGATAFGGRTILEYLRSVAEAADAIPAGGVRPVE